MENSLSIADALLRLKVIEKILIKNNLTTQEELDQELKNISNIIIKTILEKANVPGNLDEIIDTLNNVGNRL